MTDPHPTPHRATPKQWEYQERWAEVDEDSSCFLELRDSLHEIRESLAALEQRVGELEALHPPLFVSSEVFDRLQDERSGEAPAAAPAPPAGSLVEVVASAINNTDASEYGDEARAAIAAVAGALLEWHDSDEVVHTAWAAGKWLEREAGR